MILESPDEIRRQGVRVYGYRTPEKKAQPLDVSRWRLLPTTRFVAADGDGTVYQYIDLPTTWSDSDIWHGEGTFVATIGMDGIDWTQTLTAVNVTTPAPTAQPDRIAHAVSILAGATEAEITTFARLFVAANAVNADITINALVCATYDEKCANIVDSIIAVIMAATDTQRDALATALAQRDPHMADALATALDNALYDSQAPHRRHRHRLGGNAESAVDVESGEK